MFLKMHLEEHRNVATADESQTIGFHHDYMSEAFKILGGI